MLHAQQPAFLFEFVFFFTEVVKLVDFSDKLQKYKIESLNV